MFFIYCCAAHCCNCIAALLVTFLDVLVERKETSFITSVYRKETFSGDYISWNSFCPVKRKTNLIACLVNRAMKICSYSKLNDEVEKIKRFFQDLGYPDNVIETTIKRSLDSRAQKTEGPKKCPVYLRLPYIGPIAEKYAEKIKKSVSECHWSTRLRIIYGTRTCLHPNIKDRCPANHASNVIYRFKCHCESGYVGRTSKRLHQRIREHVPKNLMTVKSSSSIGQHLQNSPTCYNNYNEERFEIIATARNDYHLAVLESLYILRHDPILCRQKKFVYSTTLFKMLN